VTGHVSDWFGGVGWRLAGGVRVTIGFVAAIGLAAAVVWATGGPAADVLTRVVDGSVGSSRAIGATITASVPLLLVASSAIIAMRAGVLNIGQEGQVLTGAMTGAVVALEVEVTRQFEFFVVLVAAALGGAAWAGVGALLAYRFRVNVAIATLLLTFVAFQVAWYSVNQPWFLQELPTNALGRSNPQSDLLPKSARLPSFEAFGVVTHGGVLIALAATLVVAWVLARTAWGFRVRVVGANPVAASESGISPARVNAQALCVSGALAGLAGGVILTGTAFRFQPGIADSNGWDGFLVALVAGLQPRFAVPAALLFGALRTGGDVLSATGSPASIVEVVQALIVIGVSVALSVHPRTRRATKRTAAVTT